MANPILGCMRLAAYALCVSMLAFPAAHADAQCAFARPKKAGTYHVSLVPTFQGCSSGTCYTDANLTCHVDSDCPTIQTCEGSLVPNAATEGGPTIIGCQAPQLWPGAQWIWDSASTSGRVQMKPGKNKFFDSVVTDPNARDVAIQMGLAGVRDTMGQLANGNGQLLLLVRWTLEDRANGDMTMINFPITKQFQLSDGKAKLKFSINAVLSDAFNGQVVAGLPGCTLTEVLSIRISDGAGVPFASPGLL